MSKLNAVDNPAVLREIKWLDETAKDKNNVFIIRIHSFEFTILSFKLLEQWVFAEIDEFREKRETLFEAKNKLVELIVHGGDATVFSNIKESINYDSEMNTEQVASKLLFDITRNTGFETSKGSLGQCFIT